MKSNVELTEKLGTKREENILHCSAVLYFLQVYLNVLIMELLIQSAR